MKHKLLPSPWILLSGLLIVISFPHWNWSFLIWIALIPWLFRLQHTERGFEAVIDGIWLSFFMSMGGYYWVAYAIHNFGQLPWVISVVGLMLFSLFNQPQFPVFGLLYVLGRKKKLFSEKPVLFHLQLALLYTAVDWVLPKLFLDTMGHSLFNAEWMRQAADIGGGQLLTLVVFAFNFALARLWFEFRQRREPSLWPTVLQSWRHLVLGLGLFLLCLVYGFFRYEHYKHLEANPPRSVKVAAIQANIGDFDKVAARFGGFAAGNEIINTYIGGSNSAINQHPDLDFIVWPETAYPSNYRKPLNTIELGRDQRVEGFVRSQKKSLLFGGYDREKGKDFNSLFMLTPWKNPKLPGDGDLQVYHKGVLLPFGEYIPGFSEDSIFKDLFPQMGFFGVGPGPVAFDVLRSESDSVRIGPMICYEALLPWYGIGIARAGADLILNITNDSWFGPFGEPYLHQALTVFRSIETRLPQFRATNTGISVLSLPSGDLPHSTAVMTRDLLVESIPLFKPGKTLMVRLGDWFGGFCLLTIILLFGWHFVQRKRRVSEN